jgi:hypothetical protein
MLSKRKNKVQAASTRKQTPAKIKDTAFEVLSANGKK